MVSSSRPAVFLRVASAQMDRQEQLRIDIVRIFVNQRFHLGTILFISVVLVLLGLLRSDIKLLVIGRLVHQRFGLFERGFLDILHGRIVADRLHDSPIRHGRIRIQARGFFKSAIGLEIPEAMQQVETLIEVSLRLRGFRGDFEMAVADSGDAGRRAHLGHFVIARRVVFVAGNRSDAEHGRERKNQETHTSL